MAGSSCRGASWSGWLGVLLALLTVGGKSPAPVQAADLLTARSAPMLRWEKGDLALAPRVLADRFVYRPTDEAGQIYVMLPTPPQGVALSTCRAVVELRTAAGETRASVTVALTDSPKLHGQLDVTQLPPGAYVLAARLEGATGAAIGTVAPQAVSIVADAQSAANWPGDHLPLQLPAQPDVSSVVWPTHAPVALPAGLVKSVDELTLYEDGQPAPADIRAAGAWSTHPGASLKWVHVHFLARYRQGQPARYELRRGRGKPAPAPGFALRCVEEEKTITVDTGAVRFVLSKSAFAGLEQLWYDPTGKGRYDAGKPLLAGPGGPYLVDGRAIRFDSINGSDVTVTVEEQSPLRVVIRAEGWYDNAERRVKPVCRFVTRMTAWAGQPVVRVQHHTILGADTRLFQIADLGFAFAAPLSGSYALGLDGQRREGELPPRGHRVFLHQDRYDHVRLVDTSPGINDPKALLAEGQRSDGWFQLKPTPGANSADDLLSEGAADRAPLTLLLRDIWQKFPKQATLRRDGATLHFWPSDGRRSFSLDEELALGNIYKFWCWHQHQLLDLTLPPDYFEKLKSYPGTFENVPEHALNGNASGVAIGNDFMLLVGSDLALGDPAGWAKLFQENPTALPPARWNADSGVMGDIAAADDPNFQWVEEANENAFLSYTRSVERGNAYGMFNYADTHTYWIPTENRADLHRVWHNSHYHEVGKTWLLYFRSGSRNLLRWARPSTDHYINVDTINYADPEARLKFHALGAMYHCKGQTHWGSEGYGMERRDTHAGLWGHWVDPDASLWAWLIDANDRARDVYRTWHQSIRNAGLPLRGTRREINTSLAIACTLYEATLDPDILPAIHGMGRSLREDEPLENQNPGPMWHPLWVNRYLHQTRDPQYDDFLREHGSKVGIKDTWVVALAAQTYQRFGERQTLVNHFDRLLEMPRNFYRDPGDSYDWYGWGPGPLGSRWFWFGWPYYLKTLQQAGITQLERQGTPSGAYPFSPSRPTPLTSPAGLTVYLLQTRDEPLKLDFTARSFGGDLHMTSMVVYAPSGKQLQHEPRLGKGGSSARVEMELPADGETGLYRVEFRAHEAGILGPISNAPHEATQADPGRAYRTMRVYSHVEARPAGAPLTVRILSGSDRFPCSYRVLDANGQVISADSLFLARQRKEVQLAPDPATHPQPWLIDIVGLASVTYGGEGVKAVLIAPELESLQAVRAALPAQP